MEGLLTSCERGFDTTNPWWFRIAQAFGLPVVPEVYIRHVRSRGVLFAVGDGVDGLGRSSVLMRTVEGFVDGETFWKDDKLREKWRKELGTNSARSGVETIV